MKFQESESVELKSIVQDDKMIKETDGDSFEEMRSINQALSFDALKQEFERCHWSQSWADPPGSPQRNQFWQPGTERCNQDDGSHQFLQTEKLNDRSPYETFSFFLLDENIAQRKEMARKRDQSSLISL